MAWSFFIFPILLYFLYLLSGKILKEIQQLGGLEFLSFLILPGTVVHELSHMICAELLFVKTAEFSFKPEIFENEARVGSLKMIKTDPIRRTIIGLAPPAGGLAIIGLVFHFYLLPQFLSPPRSPLGHLGGALAFFAILYLIFAISITMFSSRKDLEVAIVPALILLVIITTLWLLGFKLTIPNNLINLINNFFIILNKALALVLGIDIVGFLLLKGLNLTVRRLLQ